LSRGGCCQPKHRKKTQNHRAIASSTFSHPLSTQLPKLNPQSQSLSRGYGSILPTSLIYIVLSTRGCTPWRPEAVMSTTRSVNKSRHWVFTGRRKRTRLDLKNQALLARIPPRFAMNFRGIRRNQKEKRTLPGALASIPNFVCVAASSTFWYRNINLFPFRWPDVYE